MMNGTDQTTRAEAARHAAEAMTDETIAARLRTITRSASWSRAERDAVMVEAARRLEARHAPRTADRLTAEDLARMAEAIGTAVATWYPHGLRRPFRPEERDTLHRIAAHAIGCSADDLRDSEHAQITDLVNDRDLDR